MAKKTNFTSHTLCHKKFPANVKGYDALEVDKTLDKVIQDYEDFEKYCTDASQYIKELEQTVTEQRDKVKRLEIENAKYKSRLSGVTDDDNVSRENIALIMYCRRLEAELYKRGATQSEIEKLKK